ncbi:MAG: hypothetical protein ACO331_14240 [Prochlorothrix sp.]
MPRPSYGPKTQQRCLVLFAAIVRYANGELEADDRTLDRLQRQIQTQWQDDRRVVVRTKVRHLEELTGLGGMRLTAAQIKEALARLGDYVGILEDNRPTAGGSEHWHFTLQLLASRWDWAANQGRFGEVWQARRSQGEATGSLSDGVSLQATPIEPVSPTPPLSSFSSPTPPLPTQLTPDLCRSGLMLQRAYRLSFHPGSLSAGSLPAGSLPASSLSAGSLPAGSLSATIDRPPARSVLDSPKMDAPEVSPKALFPNGPEINGPEINGQEINAGVLTFWA